VLYEYNAYFLVNAIADSVRFLRNQKGRLTIHLKPLFMKKNYKLFSFSRGVTLLVFSLLIGSNAWTQEFPILLHANGQDVYVESMDVGPSGDIYVTGRTGLYDQFTFNPCWWNIWYSPSPCTPAPLGQSDIFIARFHPDDITMTNNTLVWMVVGRSSISPSPSVHSGKDIEVGSDESAYVVGTMSGDVTFQKIWPTCGPVYPACATTTINRHWVGRFDANGVPMWIADAQPENWSETYGEAITLDEGNNRLFTGGYATPNASSDVIYMRNSNCTNGCSFLATPMPSGALGFVSQYDLSGTSYRAGQVGERVMALTMDANDSEHVWATGSTYNSDLDVLLADLHMTVSSATCVNFGISYKGISGDGDDIGLDIACTEVGDVMLVGAFTQDLTWTEPPGGFLTIPAGMSEIFVGTYGVATDFTTPSTIPFGVPSTVLPINYRKRTACIAADNVTPGSDRVVIGYDAMMNGTLETQDIDVLFNPISNVEYVLPVADNTKARAMEIEFGNNGAVDDRFFAGDFYHTSGSGFQFGASSVCTMGNGWFNEGFVTRLDNAHVMTNLVLNSEELEADPTMELFPNPADDQLVIRGTAEIQSFKLYDGEGRVLVSEEEVNSTEHLIDVSNFTSGVYLIEIQSKQGNYTKKLTVK